MKSDKRFLYHIGWTGENGAVITDGPRYDRGYAEWEIECPRCHSKLWRKPYRAIMETHYRCRSCMHEDSRDTSDTPSKGKAFWHYRTSAKKRGYEFNLTYEQFLEIAEKDCHYCGLAPSERYAFKPWHTPAIINGIDRVDNSLGYSVENSVPCCLMCNKSKNKYDLVEWLEWVSRVYNKSVIGVENA